MARGLRGGAHDLPQDAAAAWPPASTHRRHDRRWDVARRGRLRGEGRRWGSGYENVGSSGAASGYELTGVVPASGDDGVGSGASSGYAEMGATGSAFGGSGFMGTTGLTYDYPMGPSGSGFMTGTPIDFPIGSVPVAVDPGVIEDASAAPTPVDADGAPPDAQPGSAEGGEADATNLEAGTIVLGSVVAPPDAGADE